MLGEDDRMNHMEFSRACQPLNETYKKMFHNVPTPLDYACTREEYFVALEKAVAEKKQLSAFLITAKEPSNDKYKF